MGRGAMDGDPVMEMLIVVVIGGGLEVLERTGRRRANRYGLWTAEDISLWALEKRPHL